MIDPDLVRLKSMSTTGSGTVVSNPSRQLSGQIRMLPSARRLVVALDKQDAHQDGAVLRADLRFSDVLGSCRSLIGLSSDQNATSEKHEGAQSFLRVYRSREFRTNTNGC
jgi:hypothetical protein